VRGDCGRVLSGSSGLGARGGGLVDFGMGGGGFPSALAQALCESTSSWLARGSNSLKTSLLDGMWTSEDEAELSNGAVTAGSNIEGSRV